MRNIVLPPMSKQTLMSVHRVMRWDVAQREEVFLDPGREPSEEDRRVAYQFMWVIREASMSHVYGPESAQSFALKASLGLPGEG